MHATLEFLQNFEAVVDPLRAVDPLALTAVIALLAVAAAVFGRHRTTLVDTVILALVAIVLELRGLSFPATLLAVLALLHALRAPGRRRNDERSRATLACLTELNDTVGTFIEAVDRRTRELDRQSVQQKESALFQAAEDISAFARSPVAEGSDEASAPLPAAGCASSLAPEKQNGASANR